MFLAWLFIVWCILFVIAMIFAGTLALGLFEDGRWALGSLSLCVCIGMFAYACVWVMIGQEKQNCKVLVEYENTSTEYLPASCSQENR